MIGVPESELRSLVDEHREQIKAIVTRHRGRSVALFGSVARGEETSESDLDFLVEFDDGASLFDLVRIEMDLTELLGCAVDVVSVGGLLPEDDDVRRDAVSL
jgi:predicted nucleotidyltransferase